MRDWGVPEHPMVAYRCFKPFVSLLQTESPPAVQYWALWAIHHVCVKDGKILDNNVCIIAASVFCSCFVSVKSSPWSVPATP